ncbi:gluconokinase [Arthrobacter sp. MDT1-65]
MDNGRAPVIVVMGVQGCGKSTLGSMLADTLGVPFVDGDDLHPARNRALMSAGTALTDEDRLPWLHAVGARLADGTPGGIVVACSALKRTYRDLLRGYAPGVAFVHPYGPRDLVAARISLREHEYMPPSLLDSQYSTLEHLDDTEDGIVLDLGSRPQELVSDAAAFLDESRTRAYQQD